MRQAVLSAISAFAVTNRREPIHAPKYKQLGFWGQRVRLRSFRPLPVEYQIDHDVRFVTITGRGDVVLKDILDCMDAVVAQDAMGYPKLIDTREAGACFSDDDIMTMGASAQAYAVYDPRGPVAIVAASLEMIGYMSRFANLAAGDRPIKLFVAVEQARAWLHETMRSSTGSQSNSRSMG
jgi:hypothetical protein